jgi:Rrf2 family iron-sulfur cluster assembly transcriptional regulator
LARSPEETRIADIMLAVDEPIKATRCEIGSPKGCTGQQGRCSTHDLWEELGRQIHIFLNAVTLADVVNKRVLGMSRKVEHGEPKEHVAA